MQNKIKTLLFDFDGTLINSAPGVFLSFQHTLQSLGVAAPSEQELLQFIGPGAKYSLTQLLPGRSEAEIDYAVRIFREKYDTDGYKLTTLYPGVLELLDCALDLEYELHLTSMKGNSGVEKLVPYLGLGRYFKSWHGSDPYGPIKSKPELLRDILQKEKLAPAQCAIIGDTFHDVSAGKENNLFTIGVLYGYGSLEELTRAGADKVVKNMRELGELLRTLRHLETSLLVC